MEGQMQFRLLGLSTCVALFIAFTFSTLSAHAPQLDDRIKIPEEQLSSLKEQQIELKRQATSAAADNEQSGNL
jgi:hypothetical protein